MNKTITKNNVIPFASKTRVVRPAVIVDTGTPAVRSEAKARLSVVRVHSTLG